MPLAIRKNPHLLLAGAVAVQILLSARRINFSLSYNESHNLVYAMLRRPMALLKIDDMHPPGFYLFMHFWEKIAGLNDVPLRLPSLLFGIASLILLYIIGKRIFSQEAAVAGAFLYAVSPMQIMASTELRPYALLTLMFLVSLFSFLRILEENRDAHHFLNSAATFVAMFLHYYGAFLPAYQFLYLALTFGERRTHMKKWILFQGAAALLYLPFAYVALTHQLKMVNPLSGADILTFSNFIQLLYSLSPLAQQFSLELTPWIIAVAFLFAGLVIFGMMVPRRNLLLSIYVAAPIVIVALVSNVAGLKFFQLYHLGFLVPAVALIAAHGLSKLKKAGWGICCLIVILGIFVPFENPTSDWKRCAAYLQSNLAPTDMVAVCPQLPDGLLYYWPLAPDLALEDLIDGKILPERFWLVQGSGQLYCSTKSVELFAEHLSSFGYSYEHVDDSFTNIDLFLFQRRKAPVRAPSVEE